METPRSPQNSSHLSVECIGRQIASLYCETAEGRIRPSRKIDPRGGLGFHVEHKVVSQLSREDQRRTLDGKDKRRLAGAENLGRVRDRPQCGQRRGSNRRQTNDQH